MITPFHQQPSIHSAVRAPASAPYAGPERRVADRRRSESADNRAFGFAALGPYLPDRLRVVQQHLAQLAGAVAEHDVEAKVEPTDLPGDVMVEADGVALAPVGASLPWITSFLDDEGAEEPASEEPASEEPVSAESAYEEPMLSEEREIATLADAAEWTLEAAAGEMERMAASFGASTHETPHRAEAAESDAAFADEPAVVRDAPLAMWSDDDFIDVLPVHIDVLAVGAPLSESGDDTSSWTSSNEAAASALESVAQRVRAGELSLGGFDAALGEAAALARTLAALLSHRN